MIAAGDARCSAEGATLLGVADDEPHHSDRLEVVATVSSEAEADLIRQRLAEEGITALAQRSIGGPQWGLPGAQYVYVEADELERARGILAVPEFTDEELAELSEQAAEEGEGN